MLRSLMCAVAIITSFASSGSFALSLGNMRTKSALNERLVAEIELNVANVSDLDELKISLASAADFARVGLERPAFLNKLRFKPVQIANGTTIIQVTTNNVVREPFLDFLIDINWPKGRISKKFTTLLDPRPAYKKEFAVAKTLPKQPKPLRSKPVASDNKVASNKNSDILPVVVADSPVVADSNDAKQYGPVRKGTTLSQIANSLKTKGITANQIAMLLFRNNPQAFVGNNINRLKSGVVLKIPAESITLINVDKLSPDLAGPNQAETNQANTDQSETNQANTDQLRIATQPPSTVATNTTNANNSDLMLVKEANETNRKETEELRSKIKDLESQLIDIQQLLKLKSEQLAQVQNTNEQLVATQSLPLTSSNTKAKKPKPIKNIPKAIPTPKAVSPTVLPPQPLPTEDWLAYLPDITSWLPSEFNFELLIPTNLNTAPAMQFIADPTNQILMGGGGLLVLLIFIATMWFKRKIPVNDETRQLEDSEMFTLGTSLHKFSGLEEHSLSTLTKKPDIPSDTSFITDFSPSDIEEGQQETGEVDPAAEADVYIAYGRYQQAENLITETLVRFPERIDLKLKLIEIYHNVRNVAGFINLAEELNADNFAGSDPQGWRRICDLGRDLAPGNPLFNSSDRAVTEPRVNESSISQKSVMALEDFEGLDLNLDTVLSELPSAAKLNELRAKSIQTIVTTPQMLNTDSTPIFVTKRTDNQSLITKPQPIFANPNPISFIDDDKQEPEFEVDLDLSELPSVNELDLGILNFGDDTGIKTKQPIEVTKTTSPQKDNLLGELEDFTDIDLHDLGLGSGFGEPVDKFEPDLLNQFNASNNSESVETKLDLARVYLDIDTNMAKEMLEEVLKEGDSIQKEIAKELLATIN